MLQVRTRRIQHVGDLVMTDLARTVQVPDELGTLGLSLAANTLEHTADQMAAHPMHAHSLQLVADWLRKTAVQVPEPSERILRRDAAP